MQGEGACFTRARHAFEPWLFYMVQATFELELKFEPKFSCVKKWPLFCWMLSWWKRISKSECWRRRGSLPHLSCTKTSLSRGLRPIFPLNLRVILTLGYEQFWLQSNFCNRWFFSLSEKNFVTNKVFEPASCAEVRTFIAFWTGSVRLQWGFESEKKNTKAADETKKNRKLGPKS